MHKKTAFKKNSFLCNTNLHTLEFWIFCQILSFQIGPWQDLVISRDVGPKQKKLNNDYVFSHYCIELKLDPPWISRVLPHQGQRNAMIGNPTFFSHRRKKVKKINLGVYYLFFNLRKLLNQYLLITVLDVVIFQQLIFSSVGKRICP